MGIRPEVCHLNEGHAAFAVLQRAWEFMQASGQSFEVALAVTRAGNVFTTHTAVPAGFDRFAPELIRQYLARYASQGFGISIEEVLVLGRQNPHDESESFNMAYLAIRGSGSVNGVNQLHGQVSRRLFEPLFPGWPEREVPVAHVTNGVHMPSWDSSEADEIWTHMCGQQRWLGISETLACDIEQVTDEKLWQFRVDATRSLVEYARQRLARQLAGLGSSPDDIEFAKRQFDPSTLTLGFARRFATYKRPNLLLHDPDRLIRLLTKPDRPVQLIIAGKAHPADKLGQELIRQWIEFIRQPAVRSHVMFLSDYDMLMTENLVQGVDVWINTPRRPWEASGTSGMKALVNGGLNLSQLDGWWAEAYTPEVGWAIGDGQEHDDDPAWDAIEAEQLYEVLECEVVPEFYDRNEHGVPTAWLSRMRASMSQLTPHYSAVRTVREYAEQHYLPAATAYCKRAEFNGSLGTSIVNWEHEVSEKWNSLKFGDVNTQSNDSEHTFEVQVCLGSLGPAFVRVQLYAEAAPDHAHIQTEMTHLESNDKTESTWAIYRVSVPATRPTSHFTPRIVPYHSNVSVPLVMNLIKWQR